MMAHQDMIKLANDICPACGADLDTGYECNVCSKDYAQRSVEIERVRLLISKFTTNTEE